MEGVSFRPNIYTTPRMQYWRDPSVKTEDALMIHTQIKQENMERLKKERDEQILKDCQNFRPKLSKKSI
jgi:hypothetical protein